MKLSIATSNNGDKARLFSFKKREWPDDDNKLKLKLTNASGGAAYSENLRVLEGNEHPELFLLWLQEYRQKIWSSPKLNMTDKHEILLRITKGEAHSLVTRTMDLCKGRFLPNGEPIHGSFIFKRYTIKLKLQAFSHADWLSYITPDGEHANDIILETIHALKLEIYGNDSYGRSSYTKLKRQMRALRVDLTNGIRKWATRMEDFQSYLPDMLWEAGERRGQVMTPFDEMELRELLDGCLHKLHLHHLTNLDWDVLEKDYHETIAKLESLEPQIMLQHQHEKRLAALEGDTSASPNNKRKGKGDGKPFNKKQRSDSKPTTERKPCPICGKFHKGECYFKNKKPNDNKDKRKWTKETIHLIKQVMDGKHDDSSTESVDSTEEPSWKKGKSQVERAYLLGAAQAAQNCSDSDVSLDSYQAKQYQKRFRRAKKKKKF